MTHIYFLTILNIYLFIIKFLLIRYKKAFILNVITY